MKTANKPKRNYARWIILIVAVLLCALYFFVPPVQEFVGHAASVLASADVDSVVEYIRSFGAYAMIFSFCLMVFQSVMAPLPAFLITFANAAASIITTRKGALRVMPQKQEVLDFLAAHS